MNIYKIIEEKTVAFVRFSLEKTTAFLNFMEEIRVEVIAFAVLFAALYIIAYFASGAMRERYMPWEREEMQARKKQKKALKKKKWFEY